MSGYDAGRVKFLFVLTAILGIGVLMIVHEGGHYLAARMFGMRVLRFSIGIGPTIWKRQVGEHVHIVIGDKAARAKTGFIAERADGERLNITRHDLNVPSTHFRRFFHQRAYDRGPPQHRREREQLMPFNKWWYETLIGPDPLLTHNYALELLESVNKTLGYGPNDPKRIVRLEARVKVATYSKEELAAGDIADPHAKTAIAIITPTQAKIVSEDGTEIKDLDNASFAE